MAEYGLFLKSVTVPTAHMDRAVEFYEKLGFSITHGGKTSDFTSVKIGAQSHINLVKRGTHLYTYRALSFIKPRNLWIIWIHTFKIHNDILIPYMTVVIYSLRMNLTLTLFGN